MPLEAKAGERVPPPSRARAGVRQPRAGSWESVLSGRLDARFGWSAQRVVAVMTQKARTEGANNAGLTQIDQASTWFTWLKVETHSELRKPLVGLTGFEPATT